MSAIILQNEIAHYEVLGRGRPVLFLHGWVGSWRYWIPAMQALSVSYRAYAIDFWGFGDSAKDRQRYQMDDQVGLLEAFLEQMGIARVALVGHGFGSVAALLFAGRFPELVDRVMAIALPAGPVKVNPRLLSDAPVDLVDWLLGRSEAAEPVRVEASKTDPEAIKSATNSLDAIQIADLAAGLATPALLVNGVNDQAVTLGNPDVANFDLPEHFHAVVFEQSGHFPMLDEPAKFNRLLNDFLGLKSGESPRQLQLKEEWKRRVR
jgi:3-oxoadipate enol-lactonase